MSKSLLPAYIKWEKEGQEVQGVVQSISELTNGKFESSCKRYTLLTSEGLQTVLLGAVTDEKLEGCDLIGREIKIIYKGRLRLEGGRSMNNFEINDLTEDQNG